VKAVARGLTVEREKLRRDDSQGKMVLVFRYFGFLLGGLCHQREIRIKELPVNMMQFVAAFGFLAFGLVLFATRGFHLESNKGLLNNNIYNS